MQNDLKDIQKRINVIQSDMQFLISVGQKFGGMNPLLDLHFELEDLYTQKDALQTATS